MPFEVGDRVIHINDGSKFSDIGGVITAAGASLMLVLFDKDIMSDGYMHRKYVVGSEKLVYEDSVFEISIEDLFSIDI